MAEINTLSLLNDANLRAYYRLESGALTTDSGANGYTLTNNNTVGEGTIKYGGCADFGASNSNKALDIDSDLGITGGNCSISLWVKLQTEIGSGNYTFACQSDGGNKVRNGMFYQYNSGTRRMSFFRARNEVSFDFAPYTITLGTSDVYHMVYTYDGSNIRGYINGSLVAGPTASSGNGATNGHDGFGIGAGPDGSNTTGALESYSSALIDDVAVFDRVLTPTEILTIYNEASGFLAFF